MAPREHHEDRKKPPKTPHRTLEHDEDREAREVEARADPFADENPSICRGTD